MSKLKQQIGDLATQAMTLAMGSGLTWDESVAAFGLASKALAVKASTEGDGDKDSCTAHAVKRFAQGISQDIELSAHLLH